jgi:hypothetical protein
MIKNPKMEDFEIVGPKGLEYIEWENIKKVLGYKKNRQFIKFMHGQTCVERGAYPCDVENFLRPKSKRFFD